MYHTLRNRYYWPSLALDCYSTSRNCVQCAKERVRWRKKLSKMQLFPATGPLEEVAMDLLGPFVRTERDNRFLLVIVDRYTKLLKTVSLSSTEAYDVARAFLQTWIFAYGIPKSVLTDNGHQFTAKFLLEVYRILGVQEVFTTTYHPQTNGQTERMNRTICSALRKFVSEHPMEWDLYSDLVTYAYNTQRHENNWHVSIRTRPITTTH